MISKLHSTVLVAMLLAGSNEASSQQVSEQHQFAISLSGGLYPVVTGTTNLPDGTELFINLRKRWLPDAQQRMARGLPACGDDCTPATSPNGTIGILAKVSNGSFVAGQFSFNGAAFKPGRYPLEISLAPDPRTATGKQLSVNGTVVFAAAVQVPGDQQTYRQTGAPRTADSSEPPGNWRKIKADNGAWAAIDTNSIEPWSNGGAYAIICVADDGGPCPMLKMTRVLFDCHGHYTDIDHGGAHLPAPPLSLAGALAVVACEIRR